MPIVSLRMLDLSSPEEEKLVQDVLDEKLMDAPLEVNLDGIHIPDITTPEEEAKYQAKIDERESKMRASRFESKVEEEKAELEKIQEEITKETPLTVAEVKTAFCLHCDSKGVRHKSNCTRTK